MTMIDRGGGHASVKKPNGKKVKRGYIVVRLQDNGMMKMKGNVPVSRGAGCAGRDGGWGEERETTIAVVCRTDGEPSTF